MKENQETSNDTMEMSEFTNYSTTGSEEFY